MSKVFDKQFRFSVDVIKSEGDIDGDFYVEGYASTSDLDRQGDIILPEALQAAAKDLEEYNNTVFYGHNYDLENAVGKLIKVTVDKVGLKTKIYVSKWAKELRTKLKEGIINKYSIGGRVLQDRQIPKNEALAQGIIDEDVPFDQINIIESIELFEVSFVGVPANPNAQVIGTFAKALKGIYKESDIKKEIEHIDENKDKGGVGMKKDKEQTHEEVLEDKKEEKDTELSTTAPKEASDKAEGKEESKKEPEVEVAKEEPKEKAPDAEESKEEVVEEEKKEETSKEDSPEKEESEDTSEEKATETKEPEEEISEEEIKELVEGEAKDESSEEAPKKEESKEASEKEKAVDLKKLLEELATSIKELSTFIKEKVKTIEVSAEKKSIVKTQTTDTKKKEEEKEVDVDKAFLGLLKGETDKIE